MSEFSATDAAFEGFRVARERPLTIVAWAGVFLAMNIAGIVLQTTLGDQKSIDEMMEMIRLGQSTSAHLGDFFAKQLPYLAATIPISLLFYGIMFAAAFRVVIEPESSSNGLQVGVQELRQTWLIIVISLLLFVANTGMLFFGLVLINATAMVSKAVGGFVGFVVFLTWFALYIVVPIRLSLAGPQTFTEHRLRPFNSWSLTRGRFWPIAGTYVLATAFAVIVMLLGMSVIAGLVAVTGNQLEPTITPTTLSGYLQPVYVVVTISWSVLEAMAWAILICPAAVVYQHIAAHQTRLEPVASEPREPYR